MPPHINERKRRKTNRIVRKCAGKIQAFRSATIAFGQQSSLHRSVYFAIYSDAVMPFCGFNWVSSGLCRALSCVVHLLSRVLKHSCKLRRKCIRHSKSGITTRFWWAKLTIAWWSRCSTSTWTLAPAEKVCSSPAQHCCFQPGHLYVDINNTKILLAAKNLNAPTLLSPQKSLWMCVHCRDHKEIISVYNK